MEGLSRCALCKEVLDEGKPYTGFPPFISNPKDALWAYNDAGLHIDCIEKDPFGKTALAFREWIFNNPLSKSVCAVDGLPIGYNNFFGVAVLTSDDKEPLFQYNFLTLNKKNIPQWKDRGKFIGLLKKINDEGKWEDFMSLGYLDKLIRQLQLED
jgi:hypothetical protein